MVVKLTRKRYLHVEEGFKPPGCTGSLRLSCIPAPDRFCGFSQWLSLACVVVRCSEVILHKRNQLLPFPWISRCCPWRFRALSMSVSTGHDWFQHFRLLTAFRMQAGAALLLTATSLDEWLNLAWHGLTILDHLGRSWAAAWFTQCNVVHAIHAAGHSAKVQRSLSAAGLCHSSHCWWNAARAAELKDIDDNSDDGMYPYYDSICIRCHPYSPRTQHVSGSSSFKGSSRCREHFQETLSNIYTLVTSTVATSSNYLVSRQFLSNQWDWWRGSTWSWILSARCAMVLPRLVSFSGCQMQNPVIASGWAVAYSARVCQKGRGNKAGL